MSDAAATSNTSSLLQRLVQSRNFMTHALMLVVVLLLLSMAAMMVKMASRLPDAPIRIEQAGLNSAEYYELQRQLGSHALGNFLQADLQSYIDKLGKISWVDQVDIRRDWRQGLLVKVVPRQPVAKFGSERLVDANGVVFTPADTSLLNAHYWMQLQGDNQNAVVMMQQVKQISDWFLPLGLKVDEVIVTPRMTWLFRFDNGLRVLVDNDDTSEKLYRLSVMLQNQLHSQLPKIQTIDLRYKNGMAITWRTALTSDEAGVNNATAHPKNTTQKPSKTVVATRPSTTNHDDAQSSLEKAPLEQDITNKRVTNPKTAAQSQ